MKCIDCDVSSLESSGFIVGAFNNKYKCESCVVRDDETGEI